jgi:propanol-preferring alcohol dehydrogenase
MRAVRLHAPGGRLRVEEVPIPEPAGTEVRIRVAGAGVCHTDLHIVDGIQPRVELPRTLGHEVSGWIDAVGPGAAGFLRRSRLDAGDPVVVYGGWGCGVCVQCRTGDEQRCERSVAPGFQADGGYAEAMLVPHPRHLVMLGDLDPVTAAPLADAGITPLRAVRRALPWLRTGSRVLVIGAGALGQFALQLLRLVPPDGRELVIGVRELDPARLERASELGADVGLLAVDPEQTFEGLGGRPDVVLDFVGTDGTLAHAAEVIAPGGAVLLVGEAGGLLAFGMERPTIEAWLTTVAWGSPQDLRDVVRLARRGRLRWSVERMPLAEAPRAHRRLRNGEVEGRIVLVP